MKIFTNKKITQKIIMMIIIILLFQYAVPSNVSNAAADFGGVLFNPIQSFTLALGDVAANALNLFVYGNSGAVLNLSKSEGIPWYVYVIPVVGSIAMSYNGYKFVSKHFSEDDFVEEIELPILEVTPDKIFSNKIALLDVNIINPNTYKDKDGNEIESTASVLQKTISSWYVALRNIALVAFLSVLVYIGIRILIGSTSQDKAKYKQMLYDWIIGLCLLFFMHYIMSFALVMTEKITELFSSSISGITIASEDVDLSNFNINDNNRDIINQYNENKTDSGAVKLSWHTDLTGYIRFYAQANINSIGVLTQFGYTIMYIVLVIYTILFLVQYIKRLLNITFLTLIAPMVALAYPLDKISDGKAQAFNMWIKEYIFNLLLQPMHLILYTVLMGSAIDLVTTHPIYALVVLGFLLQAEKFIKKMFGFEKASLTGAASTGAFAGAMVMQGVNALVNRSKHSKSLSSGKSSEGGRKDDGEGNKLRLAESRKADPEFSNEDDFITSAFSNNNIDKQNDYVQPGDNQFEIGQPKNNDFEEDDGRTGEGIGNRFKDDDYSNAFPENYLHNLYPEQYDEYGNYLPRQENIQVEDKPKRKIKDMKPYKMASKAINSKPMRYVRAAGKIYLPKVGKTAVKLGAMGVGAATLGSVGLAAGLASDNFANVGKYGVAGITGGAVVGKVAAGKAMKLPDAAQQVSNRAKQARQEIQNEVYKNDPTEMKRIKNEEADNAFMRSKEIDNMYIEAFGKEKAQSMKNAAREYRKHGVTDNKIIIKAMKDKTGEIGKTSVTDSRRITAAMMASKLNDAKGIEPMMKQLKKKGIDDKGVAQIEESVRSIKGWQFN